MYRAKHIVARFVLCAFACVSSAALVHALVDLLRWLGIGAAVGATATGALAVVGAIVTIVIFGWALEETSDGW